MNKLTTERTRLDDLCINTIRFLAVDAVQKANSGHPGLPMEAAALGYTLWTKFLKHNPKNPRWFNRDRFVLSAGHGCMLLYGLLYLCGYDLSLDEIRNFRQWESKTPGHPEYGLTPGVETTTGPLGQGFATAVGMAMAREFLAARFNRPDFPLVDYFVYVVCSDGDLMEGVASEAASLAGHLKLGKLIYIYLDNRITIEGSTELAFTEEVAKRFEGYRFHVIDRVEGNDLTALEKAIREAQAVKDKPCLIVARTHTGYGSPHKQDTKEAHGEPLGADEVKLTKQNLGWPLEPEFHVPDEVLGHYRKSTDRGKEAETAWNNLFEAYRKRYPELAAEFEKFLKLELPDGWKKALPPFSPKDGAMATRDASGKTLNAIAPHLPFLIGGSADLAPSTKTLIKDGGDFAAGRYEGRNLHFGVREHAMAAILNGFALTGNFIPYGATFLNFLDYCKPSVRIAALMGVRVIYVFTHDSIGLGEDGPTHQPVEQLATLRATPNLLEIRPADAGETAAAWRVAIEHKGGPVALILTRQKVPVIDRTGLSSAENLEQGAYVLADSNGPPEILLMASGSEVSVALDAWKKLTEQKINARLISFPSFKLFWKQPPEYRNQVIPPGVKKRIAIEAASPFGWREFIGPEGEFVGVDRFGASAPYDAIYKHLGITVDRVVSLALKLLGR